MWQSPQLLSGQTQTASSPQAKPLGWERRGQGTRTCAYRTKGERDTQTARHCSMVAVQCTRTILQLPVSTPHNVWVHEGHSGIDCRVHYLMTSE